MGRTKKTGVLAADAHALQSQNALAGLGAAPRELLSTCIALFEDSTLQQRIKERIEWVEKKVSGKTELGDAKKEISSLQQRSRAWVDSPHSDAELRIIVWMRMRQGMGLAPSTFGTLRSTRSAADELVATTLDLIQPGLLQKTKKRLGWGDSRETPSTLDALARRTMEELIERVFNETDGDPAAREALIRGARAQVEKLDSEAKERLLKAINARELNDEAIRTLLLTGGGLVAFGSAVSLAGFSAYILAAQVSAFLPLVTGPALVSFVAVLSNPITIVLATAGVGVWATRSANEKVQAAITVRVIALLALSGMGAGARGLQLLVGAFRCLPEMKSVGDLPVKVLAAYQADWEVVAGAHDMEVELSPALAKAVDQPPPGKTLPDRWRRLLGGEAIQDMAAISMLTVGELLYLVNSLDHRVLAAADFSRVEDLSSSTAFAAFAHKIDMMSAKSRLGAESNLEGYVAEQVVAARLIDHGHVVEFPSRSNEAGWDLSVDGVKFQVKNASDLGLLDRHFEKGYDYPVLANSEVAELLATARTEGNLPEWADQVHFVEGFSSDAVGTLTEETLSAGDGMLHASVPVFAVTLAAVRQIWRYQQGEVTASQAATEVLINGSIGSSLIVAGNYAGVAIGLLVFGPAGAVVMGAALPILARSQVSMARKAVEWAVRGDAYRQWEAEARAALQVLMEVLDVSLSEKETLLDSRVIAGRSDVACEYLRWRLQDDIGFIREARLRLAVIKGAGQQAVEERAGGVLQWIATSGLHPAMYQVQLAALADLMAMRPGLTDSAGEQATKAAEGVVKVGTAVMGMLGSMWGRRKS